MMPPVHKDAINSPQNIISIYFPSSTHFSIPWTGGNPKLNHLVGCYGFHFSIPWTGGNPKQINQSLNTQSDFSIPWTGGNPKHT